VSVGKILDCQNPGIVATNPVQGTIVLVVTQSASTRCLLNPDHPPRELTTVFCSNYVGLRTQNLDLARTWWCIFGSSVSRWHLV